MSVAIIPARGGSKRIPRKNVRDFAGRPASREKDLGIWQAKSWAEYGERARWVGMGLVSLGLKRGEVVSILAETVPEWLYADMGTMGAGGVTNGIYPTDSAKQVDYILSDSRSRFLFVENEEVATGVRVSTSSLGAGVMWLTVSATLEDGVDPMVMKNRIEGYLKDVQTRGLDPATNILAAVEF
mgnify:CR=1 FL=1